MAIPDTLARKVELFRSHGRIFREEDELFIEIAWFQVLTGQNIAPQSYHPLADALTHDELAGFFSDIGKIVANTASRLPSHADFIAQHSAQHARRDSRGRGCQKL